METSVIMMRLAVTLVLSSIFGLERQYSHKPIGFGTFTFVATGACSMAITAGVLDVDNPLPLLSGIITGIGFLGAGALIKTTDKIFGFTTAASIWSFAIFGLIIGTGNYFIGILLYAIIWIIISIDHALKIYGIGSYQRHVVIVANKHLIMKELANSTGCRKHKVKGIEIDKKNKNYIFSMLIEGTKKDIYKIPDRLNEYKWFVSVKIE